MAKGGKRKASAPPMGYNARKKMKKRRPLTEKEKKLIYIGVGVIVVAAILFAIFYSDGSLKIKNDAVVTDGAQQMLSYYVDPDTKERAEEPSENEVAVLNTNWLVSNIGTSSKPKYYKLAEVQLPENYYRRQDTNKTKQETDFWFYPEEDAQLPLSFVYISGAKTKYNEIVETTAASIPTINETCEVGEIGHATIGGHDAYYYSYTASNTNQETGVVSYTQSLNCYFASKKNTSVVLLLNVSGDSEAVYLTEAELLAYAEDLAQYITIE